MVRVNGSKQQFAAEFRSKILLKFPDKQSWLDFSPFELAKKRLSPKSPEMLIEIGTKNSWGFYNPTKNLAQIAVAKGCTVGFAETRGGDHGEVDILPLAEFLGRSLRSILADKSRGDSN